MHDNPAANPYLCKILLLSKVLEKSFIFSPKRILTEVDLLLENPQINNPLTAIPGLLRNLRVCDLKMFHEIKKLAI